MHPDKKLGLALGILLIGVTGAFFFRNESPQPEPQLQDPQSLDDQIAQQQGPKPHVILERPEPSDDDDSPTTRRTWSPVTVNPAESEHREPALPPVRTMPPDKIAKSAASPDPIPTASRSRENDPIPLPSGNRGWEVVKPAASTRTAGTTPPASSMRRHVVRRGETLSGLASRYLGSSDRFGEIYRANRDKLRHPNDLRVGMTIRIPSRSMSRTGSTKAKSAKSRRAQSSAGRAKSSRRLPAHSVSRRTKPRSTGGSKSQSDRQPKHRSLFVPVRRPPFLRRPSGRSSKKSSKTSLKKLSQVPPTNLPIRPKK